MADDIQLLCGDGGAHAAAEREHVLRDPVWSRLDMALSALGFGGWTYAAMPEGYAGPKDAALRVTTYPSGHVRECVRQRLYPLAVGLSFAARHGECAQFSAVRSQTEVTRGLMQLLALNRRFDVTRGVVIPLHDTLGTTAMLAAAFKGREAQWRDCWHERRDCVVQLARAFNRDILERHGPSFRRGMLPALTERQRELLQLIARGHGVDEAAEQLAVSVHTVNKHIAEVKRRLGAKTSAHMIALALQWGLV